MQTYPLEDSRSGWSLGDFPNKLRLEVRSPNLEHPLEICGASPELTSERESGEFALVLDVAEIVMHLCHVTGKILPHLALGRPLSGNEIADLRLVSETSGCCL
jgi:hypothetical protein